MSSLQALPVGNIAVHRPFDTIPNELLSLILIWISELLDNDHERFLFPLRAPQSVSRRWRDVTITTPALWRTLRVSNRTCIGGLWAYLEKSGGMTLSIEILPSSFLPPLLAHAARWERVTLWCHDTEELENVLQRMTPLSTSLHHLSCFLRDRAQTPLEAINLVGHNPKTLCLLNVHLVWSPTSFLLNNLTELMVRDTADPITDSEVHGMMEALGACPTLRRLCFSMINLSYPRETWLECEDLPKAIELPNLEELILSEFFGDEILFFLHHIRCPNLQRLGVGLLSYGESLDLEIEWSAFAPVYPHLQQLDLWLPGEFQEDLMSIIGKISSISTLGIAAIWDYPDSCIRRCLSQLPILRTSIHTLQIRGVDQDTLISLLTEGLPNITTIFIDREDNHMIKFATTDLSVRLGKSFMITTWGKGDEDIWHLEKAEKMDAEYDLISFGHL
ncbi:hypothetical protein FRC03_009999 [Tulasnella sp. 419]|nr:hypothetical protein FRC03_009999 [Tulasnella sp. 419]